MIVLPQTGRYALNAVAYIAGAGDNPVRVGEIAEALDVPQNYLSKTLHRLAQTGVLDSTRGPRGGFRLAVPAGELTLARVLASFGMSDQANCLLGRPECRDHAPCKAHWRWKTVGQQVNTFFSETTVADLLKPEPAERRPAGERRRAATRL